MAACSRCSHVLHRYKTSANLKFLHTEISRLSKEVGVPNNVLNSRATEFGGKKETLFESKEVQVLLRKLTGLKIDTFFKQRKETLQNPTYKVLDKDELEKEEEEAIKRAEQQLEMPSVLLQRKPIDVLLCEDEELIGHDEDGADYVFTDISPSKDTRTRSILVRENSTGKLREASWDVRDRMQYIYWPKEGQQHEIPPLLMNEHLPRLFDDLRHEDVLDLVNIQCEPDSPDYIRVYKKVYEDLEEQQQYDLLYSTRHYGGMLFHFVKSNKTNSFLKFLLKNDRIEDCVDVVKLYALVHPNSSLTRSLTGLQDIELLKKYLTAEGIHYQIDDLVTSEETQNIGSAE